MLLAFGEVQRESSRILYHGTPFSSHLIIRWICIRMALATLCSNSHRSLQSCFFLLAHVTLSWISTALFQSYFLFAVLGGWRNSHDGNDTLAKLLGGAWYDLRWRICSIFCHVWRTVPGDLCTCHMHLHVGLFLLPCLPMQRHIPDFT